MAFFFDSRILDADAPSSFNRNMSYVTAMRTAVQEKKKKYQERCKCIDTRARIVWNDTGDTMIDRYLKVGC